MSRRSWLLLGLLSALWGSSYLFIKVALDDGVSPTGVVCIRTALAALVLLPVAARSDALGGLRRNVGPMLVLAVTQMGGPLLLIAAGEREIASSLTGILVATAPIFTFLLAFGLEGEERASGLSLAGVVIGIAGVTMLLGLDAGGGADALAGRPDGRARQLRLRDQRLVRQAAGARRRAGRHGRRDRRHRRGRDAPVRADQRALARCPAWPP